LVPDLRVKTAVDRMPSFDTQTDLRAIPEETAAAPPRARMPLPTRAAPAPKTLTGGTIAPPIAPPRKKTGQRKAVEAPPAEDPPPRAPPRKKTLPGGAAVGEREHAPAPPRRRTGQGRAVTGEGPPARKKTGQRRAIDPNDVTQRTSTAGILDEDTDQQVPPPRGRK
jgi:hypothetical protein